MVAPTTRHAHLSTDCLSEQPPQEPGKHGEDGEHEEQHGPVHAHGPSAVISSAQSSARWRMALRAVTL